jgi:hypothetical protein
MTHGGFGMFAKFHGRYFWWIIVLFVIFFFLVLFYLVHTELVWLFSIQNVPVILHLLPALTFPVMATDLSSSQLKKSQLLLERRSKNLCFLTSKAEQADSSLSFVIEFAIGDSSLSFVIEFAIGDNRRGRTL